MWARPVRRQISPYLLGPKEKIEALDKLPAFAVDLIVSQAAAKLTALADLDPEDRGRLM